MVPKSESPEDQHEAVGAQRRRLGDLADEKTDCHLAGADGKAVQQITWNQAQALLFPHAR